MDNAVLESFSKKKSVMKRKKNELSGFFNECRNSGVKDKDRGQKKSKSVQDVEELDIGSNHAITVPSPQFSFGFSFI